MLSWLKVSLSRSGLSQDNVLSCCGRNNLSAEDNAANQSDEQEHSSSNEDAHHHWCFTDKDFCNDARTAIHLESFKKPIWFGAGLLNELYYGDASHSTAVKSVVDEGECDSNSWVLIGHIESIQASIELGKPESNLIPFNVGKHSNNNYQCSQYGQKGGEHLQSASLLVAGTVVSKHHHKQHHCPESDQHSHTNNKCAGAEFLHMEDRSCVVAEPQPQAKSKEGKPHHREDDVENDEDIFAEQATSIQSHDDDDQRIVELDTR